MDSVDFTHLRNGQAKDLPLFLRKIYSNVVTDINIENKLFKYNPLTQDLEMRESNPIKPISKIYVHKPTQDEQ